MFDLTFLYFDRIYRIYMIVSFDFLPFRLPAIARRSGEADGDERQKMQSGGAVSPLALLRF